MALSRHQSKRKVGGLFLSAENMITRILVHVPVPMRVHLILGVALIYTFIFLILAERQMTLLLDSDAEVSPDGRAFWENKSLVSHTMVWRWQDDDDDAPKNDNNNLSGGAATRSLDAQPTHGGNIHQYAKQTAPSDNNTVNIITKNGIVADGPSQQKVFVFPINLPTDEHKHVFVEGISKSAKLELCTDMLDKDPYWFVDINRAGFNEIEQAMERRTAILGPTRNQTIIYADWSDGGWDEDQLASLFSLASHHFGKGNVHYITRQHIDNRGIENVTYDDEFRNLGVKWKWHWDQEAAELGLGGRFKVARYSVRSDLVQSISNISGVHNMDGATTNLSVIPLLPRPKDAVSFWPPDRPEDDFSGIISTLRTSVSNLVFLLGSKEAGLNVTTTAGIIGEMAGTGRNQVDDAYVHALLEHKIVVVAQRDRWEGHYRLMEALAGGALVMTDPMHPLPYLLENGVNVIVYSSLKELKEKILYYVRHEKERLEIAVRGHNVAMNHHRSWHVMERIVLGNWTTEHF